MSFQSGRSSGRSRSSARSPVVVSFAHCVDDRQHHAVAALDQTAAGGSIAFHAVAIRFKAMEAEVIRSPLHQRRGERHAQRFAQRGKVLEEDLLLEILRAGRDEDALAAEDCRDQIRERLAGAGAGFGEERPAVFDDVGHGRGHRALPFARLVAVDRRATADRRRRTRPRRRFAGSSSSPEPIAARDTAGTSGTAVRLRPSPCQARQSSSGDASTRAMRSPI